MQVAGRFAWLIDIQSMVNEFTWLSVIYMFALVLQGELIFKGVSKKIISVTVQSGFLSKMSSQIPILDGG